MGSHSHIIVGSHVVSVYGQETRALHPHSTLDCWVRVQMLESFTTARRMSAVPRLVSSRRHVLAQTRWQTGGFA